MRKSIKQFVRICVEEFEMSEPIFEFGSLQVPGQEVFADLRPFFPNMNYVGFDMQEGPGVDVVINLLSNDLPAESAGAVLIMDTLEHVELPRKMIEEAYSVLRPGGMLVVGSTMKSVIHCYPNDYWRFTPEGLKNLLQQFSQSFVGFAGEADFPYAVVGIGIKETMVPMTRFLQRYTEWNKQWRYPEGSSWKGIVVSLAPKILLNLCLIIRMILRKNYRKPE